jgi:hypothetical protein
MPTEEPTISPVGNEHFRAFGGIVHAFARHEFLMVGIVSALTKIHIAHAAMLMAELPYRGKRDTVLALIKIHLDEDKAGRVQGYLGELHKWSKLRNAIAHSTWKEGKRSNSIKPFSMSVRGGEMKPAGLDSDEQDYTDVELVEIARQLLDLHTRFRKYLDAAGIVEIHTIDEGDG